MELPIEEGPELDLVFSMGLPASDTSFQGSTAECVCKAGQWFSRKSQQLFDTYLIPGYSSPGRK